MVRKDGDMQWPKALETTRADELMGSAAAGSERFARVAAHEKDTINEFTVSNKQFSQQFAHIYFTRLKTMRPSLVERVQRELEGQNIPICESVLAVSALEGKPCVIIGTLYKEMANKPSILDEYNDPLAIAKKKAMATHASEGDTLVLEDEFGRVALTGPKLDPSKMVTGLVVGLLGKENEAGEFVVERVFTPDLAPQPALAAPAEADAPPVYVVLMSGLDVGGKGDPLPLQLMTDYLVGLLGNSMDQKFTARVQRVILAGDSLHRFRLNNNLQSYKKNNEKSKLLGPLKELDTLLTQLAASVPVVLMPGARDPSNLTMPQQPLHKCLFPSARTYSTFAPVTNPVALNTASGVRIAGTAGQNIDDLRRNTAGVDTLDLMESTLRWRNMCPTAPDTLACYPFQDKDPFVMLETPHVYFAGNQPEFATRLVEGKEGQRVRLISLPKFAKTGTVALLNLNDLSVHPLRFDVAGVAAEAEAAAAVATAADKGKADDDDDAMQEEE